MVQKIALDMSKLNDFQMGRISGMIHVITGMPKRGYPMKEHADRNVCIMTFDGDVHTKNVVQMTIEEVYPNVIVSDVIE